MADISKEINDFREARLGEDVRGSLISLAEKVNTEVETNTAHVDDAANRVDRTAKAVEETNRAATQAVTHANQITEEYKQYADEKLQQTTAESQTAQQAASDAKGWATGGTGFEDKNAKYFADRSKRYAVGGVEPGDMDDNARTYYQKAQEAADYAESMTHISETSFSVNTGTGHLSVQIG